MNRGRTLLGLGVVAGLAVIVVVGKGVTGRATGNSEEVGCGDGQGPVDEAEPVASKESALTCSTCDPTGGEDPPPPSLPAQCINGYKNSNESDVDCGGTSSCPRCAWGKACTASTDCGSRWESLTGSYVQMICYKYSSVLSSEYTPWDRPRCSSGLTWSYSLPDEGYTTRCSGNYGYCSTTHALWCFNNTSKVWYWNGTC